MFTLQDCQAKFFDLEPVLYMLNHALPTCNKKLFMLVQYSISSVNQL